MSDDLISRQAAVAHAISGLTREFEGEKWIRVSEVRESLQTMPSAQPEQRWIPVSERLPEDEVDVLVTDDSGGYATIGIDCMFTKEDSGERDWLTSQRVTAWMSLPKPYKEDE